jgi:hypothetical protein
MRPQFTWNVLPALQHKTFLRIQIYLVKISMCNKSLIKTDLSLNVALTVLMVLAAEVHLDEGQL